MESRDIAEKVYYDDITGNVLKYQKVIEARIGEIEALIKMGVWEVVTLKECINRTRRKPIRGRWIDINKGDDEMEVYRSRYVAKKIKSQHGGGDVKDYLLQCRL